MKTREDIYTELSRGGYQSTDINLGSLLAKRALETHINLTHGISHCHTCKELVNHYHPPLTGTGPWNSPLMIVSDIPQEEDRLGVPFISTEGHLLTMILAKAGIDRNAIYMTYASKVSLENPKPSELNHMREHFIQEVEAVNPKVILTLGEAAMWMTRNSFELKLKNELDNAHMINYETVTGLKKVQLLHTYAVRELLKEHKNLQYYKSSIWVALQDAVKLAKEYAPHYVYDRVRLNDVEKKVSQ